MVHKPQHRLSDRIVATLLVAVWLCAGLTVILLGIFHKRWLVALLGLHDSWL